MIEKPSLQTLNIKWDNVLDIKFDSIHIISNEVVEVLEITRVGGKVVHIIGDNGIILYQGKANAGKYVYLDANTLIVLPGNTVENIILDHQKIGYQITLELLKKWNPDVNLDRPLKLNQSLIIDGD